MLAPWPSPNMTCTDILPNVKAKVVARVIQDVMPQVMPNNSLKVIVSPPAPRTCPTPCSDVCGVWKVDVVMPNYPRR